MSVAKVTLTLPEDLLSVVDRFVGEHAGSTRSGVCAEALREWLRTQQETAVAEYYMTLSAEEQHEDRRWAETAARSAQRLWP